MLRVSKEWVDFVSEQPRLTFSSKSDDCKSRRTMKAKGEHVLWARRSGHLIYLKVNLSELLKDTVNDAASLNVSVLREVELDELAKATGVIVVHGLSIPKGFHDGTAIRGKAIKQTKPLQWKPFFFKHIPCLSITVNFDPDADFVQPLISEWNSGMTCDGLKGVLNHKTVWFICFIHVN